MEIAPLTDEELAEWPEHGVVKLKKPFVDARGQFNR